VIDEQTREVMSIGATGTPATFINGRFVSGARPYESFKAIVDEELRWAKDGNRPSFTVGKNVREAQPSRAAAPRRGPDPDKVYELPVGDAPMRGSATAKVRILHYLDYQ
jgi:protein-disulfide isomerase